MLQSRSLFVKNLNFKTAEESLKKHFGEHMKEGRILSVRVIILALCLVHTWEGSYIFGLCLVTCRWRSTWKMGRICQWVLVSSSLILLRRPPMFVQIYRYRLSLLLVYCRQYLKLVAALTYSLFQGTILDGHALILQLCHAKNDDQVQKTVEKDKSSTKLLVRNVAFEATEKDLRQLFSPFGQVIFFSRVNNHQINYDQSQNAK